MAQYTIEDIEIIRQKSGISYEEAVNLLEYHNGSLARALVDLEKNGRLRDTKKAHRQSGGKGERVFTYLYRTRVRVVKEQTVIVNLSILFVILAFLLAFWIPVIGFSVALLLGYRISLDRNCREFSGDSLETIVNKAKSTMGTIARNVEEAANKHKGAQEPAPQREEPRTESAASGTTPVNVQFPDGGSVEVREDADGFHEADIH